MKFIRQLYHLFRDGKTDKQVETIMEEPFKKIDETNKKIENINRLMCSKSVTYKIAQATGAL